jgi:hypothetical protein
VYGLFNDYESAMGLSAGLFGDFIAIASIGGAVGVTTIPQIIQYLGSANSSFLSTTFSALSVIFLGYSSTVGLDAGIPAMFSFGFGVVWLQSSFNTQVSYLEYVTGKSIFGITLAYANVGLFVGGLLSSELVDLGLSVFMVEIIVSLIFFVLTFIFCFFLIPRHREVEIRELQMEYKFELEKSRLVKERKLREQQRRQQQEQVTNDRHYGSISTSSSTKNKLNTNKANYEENDEHSLFIEKDPEYPIDGSSASSESKKSATTLASVLADDDADYYNLYLLTVTMFLEGFGTGMASTWSISYIKAVWGTSSLIASLPYCGFQLSSAIVRFLFLDRFIMQFGRRSLVVFSMAGAGIFSIPFAASGYYAPSTGSFVIACISLTIVGIFLGAVYPASMGIVTRLYGFTTSFSFTVANSTAFLGGAMFCPIVYGNLINGIGYSGAFMFQGGLYLIGAASALLLTHEFLDDIYQERRQE